MPRDFDFKRRPVRTVTQTPPIPVVRRPVLATKTTTKKGRWFLLIAILGLGLLAGAFFLRANQPATEPPRTEDSVSVDSGTSIASAEVQVFNGGSGEDIAQALTTQLTDASINAVYAGKTLSSYATTEIWYDEAYGELAEQVATTLSERSPTLTKSKISGVFTVQVFVGKK